MKRLATLGLLAAALALPVPAQAESGGGSRQPAGGGYMSSYVGDPYHDPRSAYSQRRGTGQILGAPMVSDMAGATVSRGGIVRPHWAAGSAPRRAKR